jgi:putative copper resistance protein D
VLLGAGVVTTAWALAGGLAAYSTVLLSAQVTQLLVLELVAPLLLVGGLPPGVRASLARRLRACRLRALARPSHALLLLVVVLAVVLQTPALQVSLRGELTHLLLSAAPLAAGLVVVLSLGPGAREEDRRADGALLVLVGVLGWYGLRMWSSAQPLAGGWYDDLGLWWSDPATDQRLAGLVAGVFAVAVALGGTLVLRRWAPAPPAPRGRRRRPWGGRS